MAALNCLVGLIIVGKMIVWADFDDGFRYFADSQGTRCRPTLRMK